jgi:hypothetical protein
VQPNWTRSSKALPSMFLHFHLQLHTCKTIIRIYFAESMHRSYSDKQQNGVPTYHYVRQFGVVRHCSRNSPNCTLCQMNHKVQRLRGPILAGGGCLLHVLLHNMALFKRHYLFVNLLTYIINFISVHLFRLEVSASFRTRLCLLINI